jgi:hypothetical protein
MPEEPIDSTFESEHVEGLDIEVKDHVQKPSDEECGYCGQLFGPEEVVIEKMIHGQKWRFCSEDCYRDFKDKIDFKDEDLDSKDVPVHDIDDDLDDQDDTAEESKDEF